MDVKHISVPEKPNKMIKTESLKNVEVREETISSNVNEKDVSVSFSQKVEFKKETKNLKNFSQAKVKPLDDEICMKKEILNAKLSKSSFSYSQEQSLSLISGDKKSNKRFICIFCNKAYDYLSHLKKHMHTHSGEKPYTCELCYKNFRCKGTLKVHLLTHTGFKPFKCQICAKEFQTRSNLKKHNLIHTDEKPYICDICHRQYRCITQMKNHRMQHFGEKKYHCSFCHEKFGYLVSLKAHLLKHTGEIPPFKCDICDKTFKMSHHLKRHKETHIGAPFVCRECSLEFLQLRELQKHSSDCCNTSFAKLDHR